MAQFDPYYMIARRLAKDQFDRRDLLTISDFMVEDIERLLGPRLSDQNYEFTGIYFASSHPRMEYSQKASKHVTKIRLTAGTSKDPANAIWQLAHECVHLITPFGGSTVLEEGVACWYQERWIDKIPQVFPDWMKDNRDAGYFPSYDEAYALASDLIAKDQNVIKRLRRIEPVMSKISADLLKQEAPWLNKATARKLAAKFRRGRPSRSWRATLPIQTAPAASPNPNPEPVQIEAPLRFDPRASEIGRQAARLHIGMDLMVDRFAQLNISLDEVYAAFNQIYGQSKLG